MRTCRRSASRLALLLAAPLIAASARAEAVPTALAPPPESPVAVEGRQAMEALRAAMAARKDETGPDAMTVVLPTRPPDADTRRRAFSAMGRQARDPAMKARADAATAAGRSGLAAQQEAMARRVGQALGLQAPDMVAIARVAAPDSPVGWVPLLFVSSSMPIDELRTYARQLERTGGALAFRGMPGGLQKVAPMAKLSAEILRLDPGCEGPACTMRNVQIVVDPIAFRQRGIAAVPALAMVPGDPTQPYCERGDGPPALGPIVYGDAALSGLLDEVARLGGREEVRDAQARLDNR